jgi:DNA polymerase I
MPPARLFLVDSFGFIFRAYHARARSGAPPMRTSTGLATEAVYIFHNMLRKLLATYKPEYIAAIFESSAPTFRSEAFTDYKANRTEMPPDLGEQIPYVRQTLEAMRIPILEFDKFEADDVIGTIAATAPRDNDGLETVIVSSDKDMLQLVNDRVSMLNPMKDDTWYDPGKVEEFMGVRPDQVADLLALKGDSVDNIPGAPGIGDKGAKDLITRFGSLQAALDRAAEVERKAYRESLQNHRDQILLSKKLATIDTGVPVVWDLEQLKAQKPDSAALKQLYKEMEFFSLLKELGPEDTSHTRDFAVIETAEELDSWLAGRPADAPLAFTVDATNGFLGLAFQAGSGRAIPARLIERVRPALEDPRLKKVVHDAKATEREANEMGIRVAGIHDDVMLYAFLLNADPSGCAPEALSERYLDRKLNAAAEQRAEAMIAVLGVLKPQVLENGLDSVYEEIDLPLAPVLARMETTGIRIDTETLAAQGMVLSGQIEALAAKVYEAAGKTFNINSPQQLGRVLFEEMQLPSPVKAGKGKAISTAADVLEALAAAYPVAQLVLDYRQLTKLKGTYVDALPALVNPKTGRVHTTFNQTGAATGRLSSSNPNLQNIPIRSEAGRLIRAAFVPEPGWNLVVADYSQIELRLLADMSGDPVLTDAFLRHEDIHTRTAAEVFHVSPLMVTPEMRRGAKAVNFGIVYGQTPFGLAQQLGIDRKEAELYICRYFERYAGVRQFIDRTIEEVRRTGFASTLAGRRRQIPDMHSRNPAARSFAERTAVNTPLQGTAADLLKIAMIRIAKRLESEKLRSRLLLQVHDELVLEAPPEETAVLSEMVKAEMEGVHALTVPLVASSGVGPNWRDAK